MMETPAETLTEKPKPTPTRPTQLGGDLQAANSAELYWDDQNRKQSVDVVFKRAEDHALNAIDWYLYAKANKRKCAQTLRLGTIAASAIAGLLPLLSQIFQNQLSSLSPAWTTIALGVAGVLMAIDKFFGCSNAWMRFIATEHRIRQALHEFQMDYDIAQASWAENLPTAEQAQAMLARCKTFISQVDAFILQETNEWLTEFQNAIKQKDEPAAISKPIV
ncbi:MAG: SLATT domain-containing protein [Methylococcaceae bacterium]|nr:SLATT domain-containing protein [Methylococcaceae bacterium]